MKLSRLVMVVGREVDPVEDGAAPEGVVASEEDLAVDSHSHPIFHLN